MTIYSKGETLLQVKNISLTYDNKCILSDINFSIDDIIRPGIQQGQVVSLIGRSGIGKTQLFRILSGLQKPDKGEILVRGCPENGSPKNITRFPDSANICPSDDEPPVRSGKPWTLRPVHAGDMGVIFQNYYQFGWRTVEQSLRLAAHQNKALMGAENDAILEYAAQFDLSDVLKRYPKQLSGGQQQRVSIIQQLLKGSDFLLLDEPFSGLDVCVLDKVVSLLLKVSLSHEFKTLIIVSHDIVTTVAISDTVFILGKKNGLEGSTIVQSIDLMERGLAWQEHVQEKKAFTETIREIKACL
ncbi:ATP-binding cassette domain-containing protein [Flavitalea sp. BT771]|uniref:ATP-binding cassette domain-containing protein n=1 Tax=Flavitalea sp. BT771 TaxID=3063329 RepID=UPI0026E3A251|nr:ATP-binding cassette domain-containing protein [Flavitalea sp. BT771]MDO6433713.1 ATP-binding cassette domain-containing protein [Flavitalea sp. BT771]MDV6222382.1 ATP-binding cassette domain-containing protein [Flavitalea sp. BT771]